MSETKHQPTEKPENEFEAAGQNEQLSLVREFLFFVTENKKWWLIPIFLLLGLIGVLVAIGSTGAAPFIYPFF